MVPRGPVVLQLLLVGLLVASTPLRMVEAGRMSKKPASQENMQQPAQWHQPTIDPTLARHAPVESLAAAADWIAEYSSFEHEEYDTAILAMLEEHIKMQQQPFGQYKNRSNLCAGS
jgi:hypothetical protein